MQPANYGYYAPPVPAGYYPPMPAGYYPAPQPGPYAQPAVYYAQPVAPQDYYAPSQANATLAQFRQVVQEALTALPLGPLPGDSLQLSPGATAAKPPVEPAKPAPQPEPAEPDPTPPAANYTVQQGDSLSKIARAQLGSADRWREIWEINRQQIADPNLILPGQVLTMPGGAKPAPSQPASPPPASGSILARFTPNEVASSLGAPLGNVEKYWPAIAKALEEAGITSNEAVMAVLATIKTEVGRFEPIPEYASGEAYNGRADLGNTHPGDGPRYKGRGFIQLTGRANYRTYGQKLGVDLEGNPDLALDPTIAARVLVEYFKQRGIAAMAERGDWRDVRRAVNGGTNGYDTFIAAVNRLDDVAVA